MKILILAALLLTSMAYGADFEKGLSCLKNGDYDCAFKELKPLADQGDALAQSNLGKMYTNGYGVKQDKSIAKQWFGKACDNKDQDGCSTYKILNEAGIQ